MGNKFILFTLMTLLIIALSLGGCTKPTQTPTATTTQVPKTSLSPTLTPTPVENPIKIGALVHFTGENAILGPGLKAALEYKLDQIGGQVAGRKIQLIMEDDATNPTVGMDKVKKLILFDKVDAVLGPTHSAITMGVANYLTATKTPYIPFMNQPSAELQIGGGNIFIPYGTNEGMGYYLGTYAYDKLGYRTATVLWEDIISGQQFLAGTMKGFEKSGGTIVQTQAIKPGTADFSSYLPAIKQADAVFYWFTPVVAQRFVVQYYAAGMKMPLIIPAGNILTPQLLKGIGEKSIGMVGSMLYTPLINTDINKTYVDNFTKKYGFVPTSLSVVADVALSVYLEAVKATNGDTSSTKINEALLKVKAVTPAGTFSFMPNGLGVADLYICKIVELPDRYDWGVLEKYGQIPIDAPK